MGLFNGNGEFLYISEAITYSLGLPGRQILNDLEKEIAVLASTIIQNLNTVTGYHSRGTRRIGISNYSGQLRLNAPGYGYTLSAAWC
jgi:hypothetical protein